MQLGSPNEQGLLCRSPRPLFLRVYEQQPAAAPPSLHFVVCRSRDGVAMYAAAQVTPLRAVSHPQTAPFRPAPTRAFRLAYVR